MTQDRRQGQGPDPRRGAALTSSSMSGEIVVIKYGGNAMINEELKEAVIKDVVLLNLIVHASVVLVHGGGPEISEMLEKVGKESAVCQRAALHR